MKKAPRGRGPAVACQDHQAYLYWNFLVKHETKLRAQPRFGPSVLGLSRIPVPERRKIEQESEKYLSGLESFRGYKSGS